MYFGADRAGLAAVDVAHVRGDAGLVLREIDQLAAIVQVAPELGGARWSSGSRLCWVMKNRLHGLYGSSPALMLGTNSASSRPASDSTRLMPPSGPNCSWLSLEDRRLEPDPAIGLHRADVEIARARVDRGAGVLLDDLRGDAVMPEERRRRQPDQAAADDQHVAVCARSRCSPLPGGPS
jgi:hypothetical protein